MSIPPYSLWRGCAAKFPQPVSRPDELAAQFLVESVYYFNCRVIRPPLADIVYRSSGRGEDIVRHVFRWDLTPYQQVFENGFQARRQQDTRDEIYYNLDHYVHHGGRPLDSNRPATHAFISTTLNSAWNPSLTSSDTDLQVYRYEIYAPGGIWVPETLSDRYEYPSQDEVCFVAGIAPQYIRSAQLFRLTRVARFTRRERVDNVITVNLNCNPQQYPPHLLNIQKPVFDYMDASGRRMPLNIRFFRPTGAHRWMPRIIRFFRPTGARRWMPRNIRFFRPNAASEGQKREVLTSSDASNWYAGGVANIETYINAAFRSSRTNEVYMFMMDEYVRLNYAPGSTDDRVINGPLLICDGYPSLTGTAFAEHGIDCAFGSHYGNEAFIFSGNLCAHIDYAPGTTNDKIIKGPMTITAMFPFFEGTMFKNGIDAAFEATARGQAYLFKDNQYARINFASNSGVISISVISQGFPSLKGTIFEGGIDAAFASHRTDEAYIFKGDSYARINFAPGTTNDYIIGGIKPILPNWPSLRSILPRKNRGLDVHVHSNSNIDRDHDEL